jgi:hypothetical protein
VISPTSLSIFFLNSLFSSSKSGDDEEEEEEEPTGRKSISLKS